MDSIIKIEFYNEKTIYNCKRFNSGVNLRAAERRPDNWNLFETYLLENFEDSFWTSNLQKWKKFTRN